MAKMVSSDRNTKKLQTSGIDVGTTVGSNLKASLCKKPNFWTVSDGGQEPTPDHMTYIAP